MHRQIAIRMVVMAIVTVIVIAIAIVIVSAIVMHLIVMVPQEVRAIQDRVAAMAWAWYMADPTIDPIQMNTVSEHDRVCNWYAIKPLMSPAINLTTLSILTTNLLTPHASRRFLRSVSNRCQWR